MKKFMIIYHASAEALAKMGSASQEERERGMKRWMEWTDSLGEHLLEMGTPLINGHAVLRDGTHKSCTRDLMGYTVIQANDMQEAISLLKTYPYDSWPEEGCGIDVYECMSMS